VVEMMVESKTIARSLFGENNDGCIATHEIYDYLNGGADPEEFATDLKRVIEHAKRLHNIPSPTPAQVFGLFERIFAEEE
jgi:hypothetical protein